jgi:hypothetical protein
MLDVHQPDFGFLTDRCRSPRCPSAWLAHPAPRRGRDRLHAEEGPAGPRGHARAGAGRHGPGSPPASRSSTRASATGRSASRTPWPTTPAAASSSRHARTDPAGARPRRRPCRCASTRTASPAAAASARRAGSRRPRRGLAGQHPRRTVRHPLPGRRRGPLRLAGRRSCRQPPATRCASPCVIEGLGGCSISFSRRLKAQLPMSQKIKCALIGPGNIGTDLLMKLSAARCWNRCGWWASIPRAKA